LKIGASLRRIFFAPFLSPDGKDEILSKGPRFGGIKKRQNAY